MRAIQGKERRSFPAGGARRLRQAEGGGWPPAGRDGGFSPQGRLYLLCRWSTFALSALGESYLSERALRARRAT